MYLEPTIHRGKKRRSSPIRVMFLLMLISAGIYVYAIIKQEQIESPFVPTPTPTRSALSYVTTADDLYLQGRITETISAYEQAIALEPDDVLLYIPMSRLLALEGRTIEAVRYAQKATEMARENAAAWAVLGMAYDWNGDVTEAIDACKYAIELDPTYAEGYAYLAEAYADAGRWLDANEAAQTALQLDDSSVDVHRNYGYVLERQANYWGAVEAYKRALEIHPNLAYIHLAVGQNYRRLGDLDSTISSFQKAIAINPNHAQANYELGWTYLVYLGESEEAESYLEQAVAADPELGRAVGGLAIAYWQRRNYEDAIPNFERAIRLECTSARRKARAFYVTIEDINDGDPSPSLDIVMHGDLMPTALDNRDVLQATLSPQGLEASDEAWANAQGSVTLDTRSGEYTLQLAELPWPPAGQVYVGWFEGVYTLSGDQLSTGPFQHKLDGDVEMELEAKWVAGPPIEYFYTLGLAYFYLAECDKAYPLFDAALQIDPEEVNALEGIRLCREAE
jgi:tetratricopeptide (TPR) repeat protein